MNEVIWHDLEYGAYRQDLPFWLKLAQQAAPAGEGVLDVGAGTGRVAIPLAAAGHAVTAIDLEQELLRELDRRAVQLQLSLTTVCADARALELGGARFALVIVPMQTVQLLGGPLGRRAFLRCAHTHMLSGGVLAIALVRTQDVEEFEVDAGDPAPLPDVTEIQDVVYFSQPTAVTRVGDTLILKRRREIIDAAGNRTVSNTAISLDMVEPEQIIRAGQELGFQAQQTRRIAPSAEHTGSQVVVLRV
ncbi:MAG: class I SAM-dependent methyltransferase [Solirubrobacteraceae bacterium]